MFRWARRRAVVETTRVGRYELRVEVLRVGTRSEGRIGRLYCDDREIRGRRCGDAVVVEPGSPVFVFAGDDREHLWSVSGWTVEAPGSR